MSEAEGVSAAALAGREVERLSGEPIYAVGQVLMGRYVIERLIARGGMGEVYEARHIQLGKRVALKTLVREYGSDVGQRRFEREARVLAGLENEHIVSAFDFGRADDGRLVLVMEYLAGTTLRGLLRSESTLVTPRAVRLILQVCRGLSAAHAAGAVHRDLKPENVFVCRREDGSEVCKILDFGLVKLNDSSNMAATRTGIAMGTLRYMSPEQALGERSVDRRSDVYSVAAILYEALSGVRPHDADGEFALMQKIVHERPRALHDLCPVPVELSDIVARGLAAEPRARFQSIDEFAVALRAYAVPQTRGLSSDSTASLPSMDAQRKASLRRVGWALPVVGLVLLGAVLATAGGPSASASKLESSLGRALSAVRHPSSVSLHAAVPAPLPGPSGAPSVVNAIAPAPSFKVRPHRPVRAAQSAESPPPKLDELTFERRNPYATGD